MVAYDLRTAAPKIGVMWSNQADDALYFATHTDGELDETWQESRTAIQGPKQADDHINLKALQAGDSSGRVFAVVKTSLDDLPNPNPNAPQIMLLVLGQDGAWTSHVFAKVGDHHSRPIVMLDEEHGELYMFATAPTGGGTIYYKRTDLESISFPSGMGTPFIQSATDTHIDDATSTKQNLTSSTGLVVLASDSESKYYLHNAVGLEGGVPPPSCTILGTSANETISGTSEDNITCAGGGNDTVKGLGGNDTLKGEAGNDKLLGGVGNDTLDGGLGTDTASYSASLTAVTASVATNSSTGEGSDTFLGVENLLGSSEADTLTGSATNNKLTGGSGPDTEQGGSGSDQVIGSGGADALNGEDGEDTVNSKDGVNGNDTLDGGGGTDTKVTDTTEKSIVNFP
ncbi:MAG TPA: calcium-binding protein [Rubrobacter sp.]|nr:calcium-binding protein [Rubrobacter sp.]